MHLSLDLSLEINTFVTGDKCTLLLEIDALLLEIDMIFAGSKHVNRWRKTC